MFRFIVKHHDGHFGDITTTFVVKYKSEIQPLLRYYNIYPLDITEGMVRDGVRGMPMQVRQMDYLLPTDILSAYRNERRPKPMRLLRHALLVRVTLLKHLLRLQGIEFVEFDELKQMIRDQSHNDKVFNILQDYEARCPGFTPHQQIP